jgi:hypothetical protein
MIGGGLSNLFAGSCWTSSVPVTVAAVFRLHLCSQRRYLRQCFCVPRDGADADTLGFDLFI